MNQCTATRKNGEQCRASALPKGSHCFAHDINNRERATAARREGGKNRSNVARARRHMPDDVRTIVELVELSLTRAYEGTLKPAQGQAVASLVGAWVRLIETGELAARVEALEARSHPVRRYPS